MKIKREMQINTCEEMCELMCAPEEHEYCLRCGRKLKNADARVLGYGTICYKKLCTENNEKTRLF